MSSNCSAKKLNFDSLTSGVVQEYELTINRINMNIFFQSFVTKIYNAHLILNTKAHKKYLQLGGSGSELRLMPSWEVQFPLMQIYLRFPSSTYPFMHRNLIGHHSFQWVVTLMFCAMIEQFWALAKPYPFAILRVQILQPSKSQSPAIENDRFSVDQ